MGFATGTNYYRGFKLELCSISVPNWGNGGTIPDSRLCGTFNSWKQLKELRKRKDNTICKFLCRFIVRVFLVHNDDGGRSCGCEGMDSIIVSPSLHTIKKFLPYAAANGGSESRVRASRGQFSPCPHCMSSMESPTITVAEGASPQCFMMCFSGAGDGLQG